MPRGVYPRVHRERVCNKGHVGWMKVYLQHDSRTDKYYPNWRCMECNRQSHDQKTIRRRKRRWSRIYITEVPY